MRHLKSLITAAALAALIPVASFAQSWHRLTGPEIALALTARVLDFGAHQTQQYNADGTTLLDAETPNKGQWRVKGNRYCSAWPPANNWNCYTVARSADGLSIRFTAKNGDKSVGRYVDLQ